jgi:hypothetical protein
MLETINHLLGHQKSPFLEKTKYGLRQKLEQIWDGVFKKWGIKSCPRLQTFIRRIFSSIPARNKLSSLEPQIKKSPRKFPAWEKK